MQKQVISGSTSLRERVHALKQLEIRISVIVTCLFETFSCSETAK